MYVGVPRICPSIVIAGAVGECAGSMLEPSLRAGPGDFERLGQTEVEDLDDAVRSDLDVARLQITMNDSSLMRCIQRFGELTRVLQRGRDRCGLAQ